MCSACGTAPTANPPPPHAGLDFSSTNSHYLASGNSVVDPGDLLDAIDQVRVKGFGTSASTQLIVLCKPAEAEEISTFRAGPESSGITSKFDFIPSASAPAYLTAENVVGKVAPGEFGGLEMLGSYGPASITPSYFIPQGYIAYTACGISQRYPLQDSFFQRSFGCGVRYRSAACVVQVTSGSVYTPPNWAWS